MPDQGAQLPVIQPFGILLGPVKIQEILQDMGIGDQLGIQFFGKQIGLIFDGADEPDALEKIKGKILTFSRKVISQLSIMV